MNRFLHFDTYLDTDLSNLSQNGRQLIASISENSGAVSSVNTQTGVVILSTNDLAEDTDKKYVTDNEDAMLAKFDTTQITANTNDDYAVMYDSGSGLYTAQALPSAPVTSLRR